MRPFFDMNIPPPFVTLVTQYFQCILGRVTLENQSKCTPLVTRDGIYERPLSRPKMHFPPPLFKKFPTLIKNSPPIHKITPPPNQEISPPEPKFPPPPLRKVKQLKKIFPTKVTLRQSHGLTNVCFLARSPLKYIYCASRAP